MPIILFTIERQGQFSIQNECQLVLYYSCTEGMRQTPATLEPRRRPNMRGVIQRHPQELGCNDYETPNPDVEHARPSTSQWHGASNNAEIPDIEPNNDDAKNPSLPNTNE